MSTTALLSLHLQRPSEPPEHTTAIKGLTSYGGPDFDLKAAATLQAIPQAPLASVVIVENHELVARSLVNVLSGWGFAATALVCGTLSVSELVTVIDQGPWWDGRVRITLVDLNLRHDLDGLSLIRPLHLLGIAVAVVSGVDDSLRLGCAIAAGAQGLVNKAWPLDKLHRVLQCLARGEPAISPTERSAMLDSVDKERRRIKPLRSQLATLTKAEANVLAELCNGRSVDEIAASHVVSVATIRSQVHAILLKLGLHTQRDAIRLAQAARWPIVGGDIFDVSLGR